MGQQPDQGGPRAESLLKSQTTGLAPHSGATRYVGRFAPSPTGPLHFGSLLAAVASYLQARVVQGAWLIRIEDLDSPRVVPSSADDIVRTLAAFGFEWQGAIAYQSQRLEHYSTAIAQLHAHNRIYSCSCSRAQIASSQTNEQGFDPDEARYPGTCRHRVEPHTTATARRFIVTPHITTNFVDGIQGPQSQDVAATCGDFVVQRRDGIYAYHLAVVVDDAAQGVTEVVRGADLLTSTARHILLQQALNLPTPEYAHIPVALDQDGRKLSKSSQSVAITPDNASPILWRALETLRQSPPQALCGAPLKDLWEWATANWSLNPLRGQTQCLGRQTDI